MSRTKFTSTNNIKSTKKTTLKKSIKLSPTNQVILAGVAVLIIFLAALLSSIPKKESISKTAVPNGTQEVRSANQVARIAITKPGQDPSSLPPSPVADDESIVNANNGTVSSTIDSTFTGTTQPAISVKSGRAVFAGNRVKYKIDSFQKLAVQPLKFQVFDESGKELTPENLKTVNEQKMHFVIVSANLREFQHLNPNYKEGLWNVSANLPTQGTYHAYIDIAPVNGNPAVLRSELVVRKSSIMGNINYPGLTPNMLAITEGVSAVMNLKSGTLNTPSKFGFSLTKDGKDISALKPLYGFFGSVIIFRHTDPDAFLRAEPLAATETKGIVDFTAIFTKTGKYTAFGEFKIGDKILVFPVTFEIK